MGLTPLLDIVVKIVEPCRAGEYSDDLLKYYDELMAESEKYEGVLALGAVIKGSTSHYDYVCAEVSKGIAQVSLATGIPVLFGVLTTDNIEQAIERAGTKAGNKGYDVACSAIEMINLIKNIEG